MRLIVVILLFGIAGIGPLSAPGGTSPPPKPCGGHCFYGPVDPMPQYPHKKG